MRIIGTERFSATPFLAIFSFNFYTLVNTKIGTSYSQIYPQYSLFDFISDYLKLYLSKYIEQSKTFNTTTIM
jgi:hypothetical protein